MNFEAIAKQVGSFFSDKPKISGFNPDAWVSKLAGYLREFSPTKAEVDAACRSLDAGRFFPTVAEVMTALGDARREQRKPARYLYAELTDGSGVATVAYRPLAGTDAGSALESITASNPGLEVVRTWEASK